MDKTGPFACPERANHGRRFHNCWVPGCNWTRPDAAPASEKKEGNTFQAGWSGGFESGRESVRNEWEYALETVLPEDVPSEPMAVASYIASLQGKKVE